MWLGSRTCSRMLSRIKDPGEFEENWNFVRGPHSDLFARLADWAYRRPPVPASQAGRLAITNYGSS